MNVMESKIMEPMMKLEQTKPMMKLEQTKPMMEMNALVSISVFRGATTELISYLSNIANVLADPIDMQNRFFAWFCFEQYYFKQSNYLTTNLIFLAIDALEKDRALLTSLLIELERKKSWLKNHGSFNFFQQRVSQLLYDERSLYEMLCKRLERSMQFEGSPYHYIEYDNVTPPNSESDSDGSYKQTLEEMYVAPLNSEFDWCGSSKQKRKQIKPLNLSKKRASLGMKYKRYSQEHLARALDEIKTGKSMKRVQQEYPLIPIRTLYQKSKRARQEAIKQL